MRTIQEPFLGPRTKKLRSRAVEAKALLFVQAQGGINIIYITHGEIYYNQLNYWYHSRRNYYQPIIYCTRRN